MTKLKIFTAIFIIVVLAAAFGLALLRTYTFKPAPAAGARQSYSAQGSG